MGREARRNGSAAFAKAAGHRKPARDTRASQHDDRAMRVPIAALIFAVFGLSRSAAPRPRV